MNFPIKRFLQLAEPQTTDIPKIVEMPPLREIFNHDEDTDDERDNLTNLGNAEDKPPVSMR